MNSPIILPPGIKRKEKDEGVIESPTDMMTWFLEGITDFTKMMYVDPDIKKFTEEERKRALEEALRRALNYLEDGGQ